MLRKILFIVCVLACPALAYGQGARYDSVAQKNVQGFIAPIPGATITVCTAAGTGTPCSPLVPTSPVTLCTDSTCSVAAPNSFFADSNGNFGFWAVASATYKVSITAPGVTGQLITVVMPIVGGGAGTFTNLTATGTVALTCKNINNVRCVDNTNSAAWAGADACAWINSAQADLATSGGTVDARGLFGTQTACAGTFTVSSLNSKPITLLLGGTVLTVQNTVTVNGASVIQGMGSNSNGPFPTRIIAGASFPSNTTLMQFDNTQVNFDMRLMNLELDCANITGCRGLDTGQLQDGGLIQDVWITKYLAATGGCINTGAAALTENWQAISVTCIRSTTAAITGGDVSLNAVGDHFTLNMVGCGTATGSTSNACIQCNNCNLVGIGIHTENSTDGVLFTGNATAGGTSSISELDCLNNVTNCLHISSNFNGNVVVNAIKKNGATNAWKNDVATAGITGTCTDENAGFYQFSFNALQVYNSCSAAGMGTGPGNLFSSPGFQLPSGSGFILTDNTASHVQKVGMGPNVTGNDQVGFFSYTAGKDVFHCALLTPWQCVVLQGILDYAEVAAPSGAAGFDRCYGDSTVHALKCSYNNGTFFQIPQVITATSAAFATATTAGTCVQNTTAVAGAATTMSVLVSPVSTPGVGAVWSAFVSSAGNVTINECAVATSAGGTIAFNIRLTP